MLFSRILHNVLSIFPDLASAFIVMLLKYADVRPRVVVNRHLMGLYVAQLMLDEDSPYCNLHD